MRRRSRQSLLYSHQAIVCCPCSEIVREEKENARKEKDRAAEIWRRIEKMGKDERIYPLENEDIYLRIYSFLKKLFLGAKNSQNAEVSEHFWEAVFGKVFLGEIWDDSGRFLGGLYEKEKFQRSL